MTDFIRAVRALLDEHGGASRWLCARLPQQLAAWPAIGLDPERLYEAGMDMFNLSGWYHTTPRSDLSELRTRLPDAALYQEMTHSTGAHRYFLPNPLYGTDGDPRTSDHQFYTTAALARARGADGMSLFNFVYYRQGARRDVPVTEPPFHVLPKLRDEAFLARQAHVYMLGRTFYFAQLPRRIEAGHTETFDMDMLAATDADRPAAPPGRLRLHLREPWPEDLHLEVEFNGRALEATPDVSRLHGNPYDEMISPKAHRRAWLVPQALIRDGLNTLRITGRAVPAELIWIDLLVPPGRPTERIRTKEVRQAPRPEQGIEHL